MHRVRSTARASSSLGFFLFLVCPVALVALFTVGTIHNHFAWDFRSYWHAGREITHGNSPYPSTAHGLLTPSWAGDGGAFLYPAPTAWAMVPFGVLPFGLAATLFMLLSIAVVPVALRLLGVLDWRCYGVVFLWLPTLGAIRLGNLTPLLLLGVAACWRLRNETGQAWTLAATVVAKLFLWPLLIWNALAGRLSRTLLSLTLITAGILVSWAAIGFAGFSEFPHFMRSAERLSAANSYSLAAAGRALGLSWHATHIGLFVVGLALALGMAAYARAGDERSILILAVGAALLLTPIEWLHYSLLLSAIVAVAQPRIGFLWFLPLAFWATPDEMSNGQMWRLTLGLSITLGTLGLALRESRRHAAPKSAVSRRELVGSTATAA
jgi:Glycosyltransferase family 87